MYCRRVFGRVQSELLKRDQSSHPNLWKAPDYDVHQIWPSRKPVSNYILKKQRLRLSLRTIEYAKNTYKNTFKHSEWIKLHLPMVKGKRNGLTSTECSVKICRILPLSPPYWKWSYHNATQSECAHRLVEINNKWQRVKIHLSRVVSRDFWCKQTVKVWTLSQPPNTHIWTSASAFCS